jgi:hypothetical protein
LPVPAHTAAKTTAGCHQHRRGLTDDKGPRKASFCFQVQTNLAAYSITYSWATLYGTASEWRRAARAAWWR